MAKVSKERDRLAAQLTEAAKQLGASAERARDLEQKLARAESSA